MILGDTGWRKTIVAHTANAATRVTGPPLGMSNTIVPLKYIEYGVYGKLIIIYPKPYSIYLWGPICREWSRSVTSINRKIKTLGLHGNRPTPSWA